MMKLKIRSEKAITLVALVVTILVLLILIGVSINAVVSNDGIIQKSKDVKIQYEKTALQEAIEIFNLNYAIANNINNKIVTPQEVFNEMKKQNLINDEAKLEGTWIDINGTKISTIYPKKEVVMYTSEEATQKGFSYKLINYYNEMAISNYSGTISEELIVPDYIDNKLVTEIAGEIINNSTILKAVVLPDSLVSIDGYSFWNNTSLTKIHFPYLLETIGSGVFGKCSSIIKLELPANVKEIKDNAFINLENCEELILGNKLEIIGDYAFSNMQKIKVPLIIHSPITSIGAESFKLFGKLNNTRLTLPNKTITIGENALLDVNVSYYDLNY